MQVSLGLAIAALSASIGIGLVFVTGGMAKLRHRALLPGVVANYRLLPAAVVGPVAMILPYVEILTGGTLMAGLTPVPLVVALALLCLFAGGMAVNIRRGRTHIDCGCGRSELRQPIRWSLVGRNVVLAVLLIPALLPRPDLTVIDLITATAGGIAIYIAYLLFNSIGVLIASPAVALRR